MSATKDQPFHHITGQLPAELANGISDIIAASLRRGMETDEAICVVIGVAADYARNEYGDNFLDDLCRVLLDRKGREMPEDIGASQLMQAQRVDEA